MKITKETLKRIIKEEVLKEISRGRRPMRYRQDDAGDETASYGPDDEIYKRVNIDMTAEELKSLISDLNKYSINLRDVRAYQKDIMHALQMDFDRKVHEKYRAPQGGAPPRRTIAGERRKKNLELLMRMVKDDKNWTIDRSASTI